MALELNSDLHAAGEASPVPDWNLVQALGWWVAAELIRRHPGELFAHLTGGEFQYDVLAVSRRVPVERSTRSNVVVWMNRNPFGHMTTGTWFDDSASTDRFNWLEVLIAPNRLEYVIAQLEREAGLKSLGTTPATTKESIGARVIAGFLTRTIFTKRTWVVLGGARSSGMGEAWINRECFSAVPGMTQQTPHPAPNGFIENDLFRYWFLGPSAPGQHAQSPTGDVHPVIGFDLLNGLCWNGTQETPIVLMDRYNSVDRRVDALISAVCPPAY